MKIYKLHCGVLVTLLVTALSVFLGNLGKTEYKSQMAKRKKKKEVIALMKELETDIDAMDVRETDV